jgi:hypothetical protein
VNGIARMDAVIHHAGVLPGILAGVSDRRECVRGEGEGQPSGLPVAQRSLRWRCT